MKVIRPAARENKLLWRFGSEQILVSESGIETADDIERLSAAGYRGFLIGESLMRCENPEALLASLTQAKAVKL